MQVWQFGAAMQEAVARAATVVHHTGKPHHFSLAGMRFELTPYRHGARWLGHGETAAAARACNFQAMTRTLPAMGRA